MPTLGGTLAVFGQDEPEPCRWCGEPTYTRLAPLESSTETIPLHAVCGAEVIWTYHDLVAGRPVPPELARRIRLLGQAVDDEA